MAQKDAPPDPKAVDKRLKEVAGVARRLEACRKQLDEASKAVKELDKHVR